MLHYFYDVIVIFISYLTAYFVASHFTILNSMHNYTWIFIFYIPFWLFTMNGSGMYDDTTFKYYDRLLKNILFSSAFSLMFVALMIFFIKDQIFSRVLFICYSVISIALLIIEHFIYTYILHKKTSQGIKNILIIGDNIISYKFRHFLNKTDLKIKIVSILDIDELDKLNQILRENIIDEVLFAVPAEKINDIEQYAYQCEEMGLTVSVVLDLFDFKVAKSSLSSIGPLPVVTFHTVCLNKRQLFLKRLIDIVGALAGLFFTLLLSIMIVPAIKIDSKGPVLFTQNRVGMNGRVFKLYKFRTMTVDAEDKKKELMAQNELDGDFMFKMKNDPRVTKVGKILRASSLDEFPQFINVLKGDMSLVGTRPPTVDEVSKYENWHRRRISIKPGITGIWQVSGRSDITDFNEVVRLDTAYIDSWSIFLDIIVIIKTFFAILGKKGAM